MKLDMLSGKEKQMNFIMFGLNLLLPFVAFMFNYINVAVNVSSKQFKDISLPDFITSILKEQGLPPSVLELEVTESAIIENDKYSNKMLNEFI